MFNHYVIPLLKGRKFRVETQEALDWYDPIKWYTLLEYQWVIENVPLDGQKVLECGGHHGHYSMILAANNELVIVEPHPDNCDIIHRQFIENMLENSNYRIIEGAVYSKQGRSWFTGQTNGRLSSAGLMQVNTYTLKDLMPNAGIIKLDIEGGEYAILPGAIDSMTKAHTWIIELHPQYGNPNAICTEFLKRGYDALKVCREHHAVEVYDPEEYWDIHSTVIFRRAL